MKKLFILLFALSSVVFAKAQCPQYLAFDTSICYGTINRVIDARGLASRLCGDSVQIFFNDSLTTLNGASKVYLHAGPEFRPFTGWQGAYTGDSAMQKIGAHLWTIKICPKNFFHYSSDSCLNSIAMGFRDSTYAHYVKDGSNDIYVLTYTGTATTSYPYVSAIYTHSTNVSYSWSDGRTDSVRLFTTAGSYTVTATGAGSCTASGTVRIRIGNSHVSLGTDTVYCTSGYVLVPTPGFASYRWGNGTTSNTYIGFNPGRIWVQATDSVGCVSHDTVTVHYSQTWGLKLGDTLYSCPGNPVSSDAAISINRSGDSLVIVYDATKGQTQLAGDTNVYFHSGPEFRPFTGWQGAYTVGHWGLNDGVGRMTSLGNNKWRIAIDPQAYYGYLPDSNLNGVFMAFRNFDASKTGHDSSGHNIFVYTNGVFPFHNLSIQPTCSFSGVTPSLTARQPLSYSWSNGVHTSSNTFTTGGVYTVTVSDGVCSRVDSVRALFSTSLTINLGPDTTVCAGQHVTISAGSGFVHYIWSTGDTTASVSVAAPATYSVTATSANGCQSTGTRRVSNSIHQVNIGGDITRCSNTATSIVASTGFVSYSWVGKPASTASTYSATNAGCYWVKALDSAGCASYDTMRVINSSVTNLSLQDSVTSCPGNVVPLDASVNISQNGDSLIIIYDATKHSSADSLVGAHKVYFHSGPEFRPFTGWQGAYTVGHFGVDDGIGQMDSIGHNLWRIAIIPQCYYGYSPDSSLNGIWMIFRDATGTHQGKNYSNADIFVYTAASPPTCSFNGVAPSHSTVSGVTYSWSTPAGTVSGPTANATTTGLYIVTASAGACSKSDTVHANFSNSSPINLGHDTTICSGDSLRIDAGTGYTHYTWSTGDTVRAITVHTAATYTVTATTGTGCTSVGHKAVSVSHSAVSLGADLVECTSAPLTISATAGFASYQWLSRPAGTTPSMIVSKTGCYWVKAIDSFGCRSYDTVSVRYSEVLQENLPDTFRTCPGNQVNLDAGTMITLAGDSIVIFYDATQGQTGLVGAHKVYMHSAPEFYPFTGWQGNYTVGNYGQDDGIGQMDSLGNNRWKITICPQCYYHYSPDTPINGIWMVFRDANGSHTGKDNAGNNIFLNLSTATPTCSFAGVTAIHKSAGTLSYSWSTGANVPAIAVGTAGQYIVTVSDNSGCSKSDTTNVIISSNLTVNLGRDTSICPSGHMTFDAGTGFTSYHWNTGDTVRSITVSAAGIYSVTVYNGNCSAVDSVALTISGHKVNLGPDMTRCTTAPVTITAPSGYASYQWFGIGTSSLTHSALHDGCYWIKATDSTGCTSYDTINVQTSGVNGMHGHDTLKVCTGDSTRFDASVNVNAAGDSLVIIYDATKGQTQLQGSHKVYMHSAPEFYPFTGWQGNYTVGNWGQDDGVGEMDSIGPNLWSITICPSCYYHFSPDTPLNSIFIAFRNADGTKTGKDSLGNNINILLVGAGTPSSSFSGIKAHHQASGNITYAWSTGANSASASFNTAGSYYVTATEGVCSRIDTVVVSSYASPTINLGNDTCISGAAVTLGVSGSYSTYLWSTGAPTATITANQPGTYWLRVATSNGCKASDTIVVSSSATINLGHDTCIKSGSQVMLLAGSGAASYIWSNAATTDTITVSQPGTYWVKVTSANGCKASDTIVISTNPSVSLGHDTCVRGPILLTAVSTGASSYLWNNNATTDTITVNQGTYWVKVTGPNGCKAYDTIVIGSFPVVHLGVDTCVVAGGSITLHAGVGASGYLWNTGATSDTLRVTAAGTYSVAVSNGVCSASDTVIVSSCGHTNTGCRPHAYFRILSITHGGLVTIKDSSTYHGAATYHWDYGDGSSDTTRGTNVHLYVPNNAMYTIRLIVCSDTCGCDTFTQTINVNVGINDIQGVSTINIHPNPASDKCTIEVNTDRNNDVDMILTDIMGASVLSQKWVLISGENKLILDVSGLASGMYQVLLRSASGIATRKLNIIK